MELRVDSTAPDLVRKYNRRSTVLERTAIIKPISFALGLHVLRKKNLQQLIYSRTPYTNGYPSQKPTFKLLEGERVMGNMVFNNVPYASIRQRMKGDYVKDGGSKEANWADISMLEYIPIMRLQQIQMNRKILEG